MALREMMRFSHVFIHAIDTRNTISSIIFISYTLMNDPTKKDPKKGGKNPIKLPANDEPWGPQPSKKTILISDKVERYMQGKGSN
jgi:hypothetical protein